MKVWIFVIIRVHICIFQDLTITYWSFSKNRTNKILPIRPDLGTNAKIWVYGKEKLDSFLKLIFIVALYVFFIKLFVLHIVDKHYNYLPNNLGGFNLVFMNDCVMNIMKVYEFDSVEKRNRKLVLQFINLFQLRQFLWNRSQIILELVLIYEIIICEFSFSILLLIIYIFIKWMFCLKK